MPGTEAMQAWIERVLGLPLKSSDAAPGIAFDLSMFAPASAEHEPSSAIDELPVDLQRAIDAALADVHRLLRNGDDLEREQYGIFAERSRLGTDLVGLYPEALALLKSLKDKIESGPALQVYDPLLSDDQRMQVHRAGRGGKVTDACQVAGRYVEDNMRAEIGFELMKSDKVPEVVLDEMRASLGDPDSLPDQAKMRALLSLRFGLRFDNDNWLATGHKKGLGRLYDVLKAVPAVQMAKLSAVKLDYSDERGPPGDYNKVQKKIRISIPLEDHKQVARPNSAGEPATVEWFKQVAFHEVGHAVDDASTYMDQNRTRADHGEWEESSLNKVVVAYTDKLKTLIGEKITIGGKETEIINFVGFCAQKGYIPPDEIQTKKAEDRDTALKVGGIVARLGVKSKFWNRGIAAAEEAANALGGTRVHFEAYANKWWSFDIQQRRAAVSDYQWRAPGEWFAEPYAMYYQGKLDGAHPVAVFCRANSDG